MKPLLLNLALALLFCLMFGGFDVWTLLGGFLVGYLVLAPVGYVVTGRLYGQRVWKLLRFGLYFTRILLKANLQVAYEVLTPGHQIEPRIVRYDATGLTDVQITTLANAITLTPGTLVIDLRDDATVLTDDGQPARYLYVHCMFGGDRAAAMRSLDELRNRLMAEVFE